MRKFLILFIVVLLATPAFAQWRRAGLYGADVRALIVDPNEPDTLYLGTSSGEVYYSVDGAKTWLNPRNGIPFPNHVVDNLVIDRAGRLWVAAWGLWGGGVIAVSNDRGRTWTRRDAGLEDFSVRAIALDQKDPNYVVVGGLTGVYRSKDGGEQWQKISEQINVESLAIDPRSRERIFVGTWRQGWRTDDGGKNWKHIANGMVLDTDMFSITIDAKNPDNMWVATCGWVYNTKNSGDLWTRYRDGFNNRRIHAVEIDPCNADTVYAGSVAGLYRSEDHGKSWYVVSDEGLVINSIVLHPQRPNRIILAVEGDGVYVSHDRGKTLKRTADGLHNLRITSVVADPVEKDRVYAAVAFGGQASGIYSSEDAGKTWAKMSHGATLPEVLSLTVAPEPDAEVRFFAGTEKGFFFSKDGKEWTQAEPSSFPLRVAKVVRFNRNRYFAATSEGVFTSKDGGQNWYRLADSDRRTVDIAIGNVGGKQALFALTSDGVKVYDSGRWAPVADAPSQGRTLAVRNVAGGQLVFVAGAHGVKSGRIDDERRWQPVEAPDAQYASVLSGTRSAGQMLFLTSRQQREILVGDANENDWLELVMPTRNTEVTAVSPDPFAGDRYYVATLGEGVYVYEGKTRKYVKKVTPPAEERAALTGGAK
ncbi:MAG TPA: YCF48-related protein [Thermoanaerobaculia bacterium]